MKKHYKCPLCKSSNTRKDYDFPKTMRVCKNCGCDWVIDSKISSFEIVFNPKKDI